MDKTKRLVELRPLRTPIRMDAAFFFDKAVQCLDRHHYEKAKKYFRLAIRCEPNNPVHYCNLAGVLSEQGQYESSNEILHEILQDIDPAMTECHFYMANNYLNLDLLEDAERCVLQYLEHDEDGQYFAEAEELIDVVSYELQRPIETPKIKCREGWAEHHRARQWLEEGRFSEAAESLHQLVKQQPEFTAARNNLALAQYYLGQAEAALETSQDVLDIDPGNVHAMCNKALLYDHLGLATEATELIEALCKLKPFHPDPLYKMATTLGMLHQHQEAFKLFRRLQRVGYWEADDAATWHTMAVASYNVGRHREARMYWRYALADEPTSVIAAFYLDTLQDKPVFSDPIHYAYHLPYEEWLRSCEAGEGNETGMHDTWVQASFRWILENGDLERKLHAIHALGSIGDLHASTMLRHFVTQSNQPDELKKIALFVLRFLGGNEPITAQLAGIETVVWPGDRTLPVWERKWQKVLELVLQQMRGRYDLLQLQDVQSLWLEFLARIYPQTPRIYKGEGWAAALEYLTAKMYGRMVTYDDLAKRYQTTAATVGKNARHLNLVCGLKQKMQAMLQGIAQVRPGAGRLIDVLLSEDEDVSGRDRPKEQQKSSDES